MKRSRYYGGSNANLSQPQTRLSSYTNDYVEDLLQLNATFKDFKLKNLTAPVVLDLS